MAASAPRINGKACIEGSIRKKKIPELHRLLIQIDAIPST
jgi:hypothetical protein